MSQPTPLPEPFLEDVDCELWGQNAKCDCYSKGQMLAYGKAEYERGLEDAAQKYKHALQILAAQGSGKVCSTDRADCMAAIARLALRDNT